MMLKVGLTGGIGSGKSTVARIFRCLGVPVYDSDSRAKILMNTQVLLRHKITELLGEGAYAGDKLDTWYVASMVFRDPGLLGGLNAIVHPAVREDFCRWAAEMQARGHTYAVQENAILFDHGFDRGMDYTVTVSAPAEERVRRASLRDGHDPQDVVRRIANQMTDEQREELADMVVRNGEKDMVVGQVVGLHEELLKRGKVK